MNIHKLWSAIYQEEADGDAGSPTAADAGNEGDTGNKGSLLDDATPTLADGEWFQSEGIKGTGDKPEWYQSDHFKSVDEQAKSYGELQKKFGSFVGSPKDGYELPEGFSKEDALAQEVIIFGEETNLSKEGFTK